MPKRNKTWLLLILLAVSLGVLYLITRLTHLTRLPIFTDEAIYIRWSQIGARDASWRFISMVDGKQPLFTWVAMILLRFVADPLVAGRLVSVIAGAFSLVGMWLLSYELFGRKVISFIACLLYLVLPFSLFYDRLALYDSLVATFYIWNLWLSVLMVRHLRLDIALLLGMGLGAGMLNKSSGFLSLYLLPVTLVLFDWKAKRRSARLLQWAGLAAISGTLSFGIYNILRLSPLFHMIGLKNAVFVYSFSEWLTHPFRFLVGNLRGVFDWATHYMTWPLFLAALAPLLRLDKQFRVKLLLYTYWLAPFVALALFGRVLYPRFILFMIMPLLPLAAQTVYWIIARVRFRLVGLALVGALLAPSIYTDYFLIFDPGRAPVPQSDRGQLIDDWPSGWGISEVNAILADQAEKGKVTVYTDGTFGLLPYAIELYLVDNPNMEIRGIWPMPKDMPAEMIEDVHDHPTFMVFNQNNPPESWSLELIAKYQRATNVGSFLRLYRVLPPSFDENSR